MHKNLSLKATALLLMSALAKGQKEHQKPPDDQQDFEGGAFFCYDNQGAHPASRPQKL